jgi:hypothetical protein
VRANKCEDFYGVSLFCGLGHGGFVQWICLKISVKIGSKLALFYTKSGTTVLFPRKKSDFFLYCVHIKNAKNYHGCYMCCRLEH